MQFGLITPLAIAPSLLGESPMWQPDTQQLWWCDIPGRRLNRFHPGTGALQTWDFDDDPACIAPLPGGASIWSRGRMHPMRVMDL